MRYGYDQICLGFFGLAAGGLVMAAAVLVPAELAPYTDQFADDAAVYPVFAETADAAPRPFVSLAAQKMDLDRCVKLNPANLLDGEGRGPDQIAVFDVCRRLAEAAVTGSPHFAYGWYIAAGAALRTGDEDRSHDAYLRSVAANPAETWLASLRFQVFDRPGVPLSPPMAAAADRDVAILLAYWETQDLVARRYLDDPGFRARLSGIAERLPPDKQAGFVGRVRALMAKGAGQPPVPGSG